MTTPRAETTLADYLRVLRRRWVLILAVTVICGAAALALSLLQKRSYNATASVVVNDPNQALSLLGTALVSNQTPLQLASVHAPQVTRPEVVRRVKAALHSPLSLAALKKSVTTGIDPNSFLVTIDAQSRSATEAAAIANAFARRDVALTTAEARRGYAAAATKLEHKLRRLPAATQPATKQTYTDKLSALQSLSSIAAPVQVSATATVPTSPTSPKPVRNTVAALIFGLLLGIALAYGRETLDRRLQRSTDVEQQLEHPVVGHIRAEALGNARISGSNGSGPMADVDAEAFRILRHNVRYLAAADGNRVGTLLVASAMAQEGKSTVAACLAMASADAGTRTLLLECDLRRPVLAARFGIASGPGLSDYLTAAATPQEIMQVVSRAPANIPRPPGQEGPLADQSPLVCITAGTRPARPADLLASERFREFLAEVSAVYDLVIVDSPPLLSVADTLEIVPHVSAVLLCVRLRQTTREQAGATRAALDRLPSRPIGVVLTDVRDADDNYFGYYHSNVGAPAATV